ncbi:hypothetical protein DTO027I6_6118 [Penicillium roqueforti]|nr:hypothetical protein DTO027I6_6118 [Penicillium roqueforti]
MASLTNGSTDPDITLADQVSPIMSNLPDGHVVHHFTNFELLQACAETLGESLQSESENQWIGVHDLPQSAIRKLDDECHSGLEGIDYRFAWEDHTGLIKIVVPSFEHNSITDRFTRVMDLSLIRMGLDSLSSRWMATTTYKPTANKGKQADQGFLPPSRRRPAPGLPPGWPTLAIETGLSESLPRLRQDALWWLSNSSGQVRNVMVISISKREKKVSIEN